MRTLQNWLDEYSASHRNPVNQRIHYVCVPFIVFTVICALTAVPGGNAWLNAATLVMLAALLYYLRLSWRLALGLAVGFAVLYFFALMLALQTGPHFPWIVLAIFVAAWIGQFIGHAIEGARPSFFKDLQFLLIGPLWELSHLYKKLGWAIGDPSATASQPVTGRP